MVDPSVVRSVQEAQAGSPAHRTVASVAEATGLEPEQVRRAMLALTAQTPALMQTGIIVEHRRRRL